MVDLYEELTEEQANPVTHGNNNHAGDSTGEFPISEIPIESIVDDPGLQSRESIDDGTVAEYAELLESNYPFPPVVVFVSDGKHLLADGFHRYHAHRKAGRTTILAELRDGERRDALLHSISSNTDHGLQRTNKDKRRAVNLLLADPDWSNWSNCEIAKTCGVSDTFVGNIRKKATPNGSGSTVRKMKRNGRTTTIETGNIGPISQPDREVESPQESTAEDIENAHSLTEILGKLKTAMHELLQALEQDQNVEWKSTSELLKTVNAHLTSLRQITGV